MATYSELQMADAHSMVAIIQPHGEICCPASAFVWREHVRYLDLFQSGFPLFFIRYFVPDMVLHIIWLAV